MNRLSLQAAVIAAALGATLTAQAPPVLDMNTDPWSPSSFSGVGSTNSQDHVYDPISGTIVIEGTNAIFGKESIITDGVTVGLLGGVELSPGDASLYPGANDFVTDGGGNVYFTAYNGNTGREVYKWDGVQTILVADTMPGNPAGVINNPDFNPRSLYAWNGNVYYSHVDGVRGRELWRTNGITTTIVDELNPGPGSGVGLDLFFQAGGPGTLFFTMDPDFEKENPFIDGPQPRALYRTNGFPGLATTVLADPASPVVPTGTMELFGGNMMFGGNDAGSGLGTELYQFNGTNIVLAADINVGAGSAFPGNLTTMGTRMYGSATGTGIGNELFYWDGTTATSVDLNTSSNSSPTNFFAHNGKMFFVADIRFYNANPLTGDSILGKEMCVMTNAQAFPTIIDIWGNNTTSSFSSSGMYSTPTSAFHALDATRVVFITEDTCNLNTGGGPVPNYGPVKVGQQIWESDGTITGTFPAYDANPLNDGSGQIGMIFDVLPVGNGRVIFAGNDSGNNPADNPFGNVGYEVWRWDAGAGPDVTGAGAAGVGHIVDDYNKVPVTYTTNGGPEYDAIHDTGMGYALVAGRQDTGSGSFSDPEFFRYHEDTNTMVAVPPINTLDTRGVYTLKKPEEFSTGTPNPNQAATTGGKTFFAGYNNNSRTSLFWTDGVASAEIPVNTVGGNGLSNSRFDIQRFTGGSVLFIGTQDGSTFSNTDVLMASPPYTSSVPVGGYGMTVNKPNQPGVLRYHHNKVYFIARGSKALPQSRPNEIWVSDGTVAGTHAIFDLPSSGLPYVTAGEGWIYNLTIIDDKIYFVADPSNLSTGVTPTNDDGKQLYVCDLDGSNAMKLTSGAYQYQGEWSVTRADRSPLHVTKIGSKVCFFARDDQYVDNDLDGIYNPANGDVAISLHYQPWVTDGTPGGTTVMETWAVEGATGGIEAAAIDLGIICAYDDLGAQYGEEIYIHTGFPGGSGLVRDINAGVGDFDPFDIARMSGRFAVFGYGKDGPLGAELWVTNGTNGGTFMAKSVNPGNGNGMTTSQILPDCIDGNLVFEGFNIQYGRETHVWQSGLGTAKAYGISSVPSSSPALSLHMQDGVMGALTTLTVGDLPSQLTFILTAWSLAVGQPELILSGGFHHVYIDALWFTLNQSIIGWDGTANPVYTAPVLWPAAPALIGFDVVCQSFVRDDTAPKKTSTTNGYLINWGL